MQIGSGRRLMSEAENSSDRIFATPWSPCAPMVSSEVGMDNIHPRRHQPTLGYRGRMTGMLLARAAVAAGIY
jgi:hypothetical protein